MTLENEHAAPVAAGRGEVVLPRKARQGTAIVSWITSTDHKVIGYMYMITAFGFFLVGGLMALVVRGELARPGLQLTSNEQFNQLFTMHGLIMLLLFATPMLFCVGFLVTFLFGALLLGISTLPFLWNIWRTAKQARPVGVDDPWGYGGSLEWATSCPPPRHNFRRIPRIRSARPAFDLHHPEYAAQIEGPQRPAT